MRPIVLFFGEVQLSDGLSAGALSDYGYRVIPCADTVMLRRQLRACLSDVSDAYPPVLAVLASDAVSNQAAATVFAAYPQVGVLVQLDEFDDATLMSALQLGVDAWSPRHCSTQTLALALHSLQRRLERSFGHKPSTTLTAARVTPAPNAESASWWLHAQGWQLEAPSGQTFDLTSSERLLVLGLIQSPEFSASHCQLVKQIRWNSPPSSMKRQLAVLVSRLRRKLAAQGEQLPLKSLHSWGYMLTCPIVVSDEVTAVLSR